MVLSKDMAISHYWSEKIDKKQWMTKKLKKCIIIYLAIWIETIDKIMSTMSS